MLSREARALLLVQAVKLHLDELAPDCLSHVYAMAEPVELDPPAESSSALVVDWHTDGFHGPGVGLERELCRLDAALAGANVEQVAEELATAEAARHLRDDHDRAD